MKLYLVFVTSLSFVLTTCSEDLFPRVETCNVTNPVEDLGWLSAKISELKNEPSNTLQYTYVSQALYEGEAVFLFNNCCPNCAILVPVYNCSGDILGYVGDDTLTPEDFYDDFIVWRPDNFSCNL